MIDERHLKILDRVAGLVLLYDPELQAFEPSDDLDAEIRYCLDDATHLLPVEQEYLRDLILRTVIDPTAHRRELCAVLYTLDMAGRE